MYINIHEDEFQEISICIFNIINSKCDADATFNVHSFSQHSVRFTRQSTSKKFILPKFTKTNEQCFLYSAVRDWNNLPNDITCLTVLSSFIRKLNNFILANLIDFKFVLKSN